MRLTFLGTGTSQGIPLIACPCAVCHSTDPLDKRLRTSAWLQVDGKSIVIDTGPDFRYQMLRAGVKTLDAVLFTHSHKDHIAGLDDVRAFNFIQQREMDVYLSEETESVIRREFQYIFNNKSYPGIPQIALHRFGRKPFLAEGIPVTPIRVLHHKMEVFGFRIGGLSYITDVNHMEPEAIAQARGSHTLVLSALRHEKHISHYSLSEAIEVAREIGAQQTYFTHISHQLGFHAEVSATLPEGMHLAHDGLQLEVG